MLLAAHADVVPLDGGGVQDHYQAAQHGDHCTVQNLGGQILISVFSQWLSEPITETGKNLGRNQYEHYNYVLVSNK